MPSRISGACTACRSKKQKCSGDRSGCAQCLAAGQECAWPEQRKRGPAKGYIEGLEHRLHEAEQLLLQLLPIVSADQLTAATKLSSSDKNHSHHEDHDHLPGRPASPPLLNKKIGIEYWEQFPLDSADNIRRWQQDCAEGGRGLRQIQGTSMSSESRAGVGDTSTHRRNTSIRTASDPVAAGAAKQLQYLSGQKENPVISRSESGALRLSGLERNSQPWSTMYADVPGAAPGAWLAGMDINSVHCTPWGQHNHLNSGQAMPAAAGGSSVMETDGQQFAEQQNGSPFFPPDSQRQFFW